MGSVHSDYDYFHKRKPLGVPQYQTLEGIALKKLPTEDSHYFAQYLIHGGRLAKKMDCLVREARVEWLNTLGLSYAGEFKIPAYTGGNPADQFNGESGFQCKLEKAELALLGDLQNGLLGDECRAYAYWVKRDNITPDMLSECAGWGHTWQNHLSSGDVISALKAGRIGPGGVDLNTGSNGLVFLFRGRNRNSSCSLPEVLAQFCWDDRDKAWQAYVGKAEEKYLGIGNYVLLKHRFDILSQASG